MSAWRREDAASSLSCRTTTIGPLIRNCSCVTGKYQQSSRPGRMFELGDLVASRVGDESQPRGCRSGTRGRRPCGSRAGRRRAPSPSGRTASTAHGGSDASARTSEGNQIVSRHISILDRCDRRGKSPAGHFEPTPAPARRAAYCEPGSRACIAPRSCSLLRLLIMAAAPRRCASSAVGQRRSRGRAADSARTGRGPEPASNARPRRSKR